MPEGGAFLSLLRRLTTPEIVGSTLGVAGLAYPYEGMRTVDSLFTGLNGWIRHCRLGLGMEVWLR